MSGVILGPPNHHDYQNQLRKLHADRFSKMPFDAFKSRVKIVKDEEVVKKWLDDQSFKTEYTCLNLPEPLKLGTLQEVESHFRETHCGNIVQPVDSFQLKGTDARNIRCAELARLVRLTVEDQKRFPLQVATVLSQQFANRGLQFFKVNRAITHVAVARPHFLDLEATPVSDGIKRLVRFIDGRPGCNRKQLIEALAPSPVAARPSRPATPAQPETAAQPDAPAAPGPQADQDPAPPPAAPAPAMPTAEQTAIITDLHWLIHQGHVIEFANSLLETAKRPLPKPPKPERVKKPDAAAAGSAAPSASGDGAPAEVNSADAAPVAADQETVPVPVQHSVATSESVAVAAPTTDPVAEPAADQAPAAPDATHGPEVTSEPDSQPTKEPS
jgi:hypothetical protein